MAKKLLRILILDDEPLMTKAMEGQLQLFGFFVESTNDPEESLLMLPRGYDGFICDNRMPRMSGLEVLAKIQGMYSGMCRFIMTGGFNDEFADDGMLQNLGVNSVLRKPFRIAEVAQRLNSVFRERQ